METGTDRFAITDFPVEELHSFTEQDFLEIAVLMKVLSPTCSFDKAALEAVMADPASHLFVMRHSGAVKTAPGIVANDDAGAVQAAPAIVANDDAGAVQAAPGIVANDDADAVQAAPGIVANDDAGALKAAPGIVANDDAGPVHRPGRIIGCCTICLFASPTGLKASLEDVAVLTFFQGHGLGRLLVESSLWMVRSMVSNKALDEGLPRETQEEQQAKQEPQEQQEQQEPHQRFSWKLGACRQKPDIQPKIHVQLTSKPQRKAANALYRSLGFTQKETNVYVLDI